MTKQPRENLIRLRKIKNLNQKDVAAALGITTSYYGMIELGVRTPNLTLAQQIAGFFNEDIDVIFFNPSNNNTLRGDKKGVIA